jgi:hypothetical protein
MRILYAAALWRACCHGWRRGKNKKKKKAGHFKTPLSVIRRTLWKASRHDREHWGRGLGCRLWQALYRIVEHRGSSRAPLGSPSGDNWPGKERIVIYHFRRLVDAPAELAARTEWAPRTRPDPTPERDPVLHGGKCAKA